MTLDEIRTVVEDCARMRMPKLRSLEPGDKVSQLEDYLVELAIARGQLEEARMYLHAALDPLLDQWDNIKGWEAHVGYSTRTTQDDIRRAKKEIRPDLHDSINEAKRLGARIGEQIVRLGGMGDEQVASRLYTLITGS